MRVTERRSKSPRQRQDDHPTRTLLITTTAELLKTSGVGRFHIDDLLEATGLTRGAVYHHFDGVDDLIESALLATYAEGVGANIEIVQNLMTTVTTAEAFRSGVLRANVIYAENATLRDVRILRAHALASVGSSDRIAKSLAREQQRLTDAYVDLITQAQQRGWVRQSLEPETLAVFIQAYSFGVIIDDMSERHIEPDAWARMIALFFERCVFTEGDADGG